MRIFYTFMLALLLPLILARLLWRSLRQVGYRLNIPERFGQYHQPSLKGCIWIHAVSVGEVRAAEPLICRLKVIYPARPILLTGMTPTGRATAHELFGQLLTCVYLPYDFVTLHQRLLDHFQPSILLIMETEIWPNLLVTCQRNKVPAFMANARLSEKSLRGYTRLAAVHALIRQALQAVTVVAAQSAADAERFRVLGALQAEKIVVTGTIKFDVALDPLLIAFGKNWRANCAHQRVLLCASTREGEEALLLDAYVQTFDVETRHDTLLVIVPRHPQRFDHVAIEIENAGLRFSRRSRGAPDDLNVSSAEVLLGDSMGEMAAYYAFCDVAIIGGSFLPLGGQNLIEACASGKPVIMGPSTFNFTEAARLAQDVGAMEQVGNAQDAMRMAHTLLQDDARRMRMADAGRKLVAANHGAAEKVAALIVPVLGAN